jgi:hypothetical protein
MVDVEIREESSVGVDEDKVYVLDGVRYVDMREVVVGW